MSIKYFYIYNSLGQILRSGYCPAQDFDLQINNADENIVEGQASPTTQYIQDGIIKDMGNKPSEYHYWDYQGLSWKLNKNDLKNSIISKRNYLLLDSDWTDTLSAKTRLGDNLYNAWQFYRQQLRDITAQSGYPLNVVWPTPPQG